MILTSRSRIVAYANCPRLGYLSYDWGGTGLEPADLSLPLADGIALHEALADILLGASPSTVISKILADYEAALRTAHGVANEDPAGFEALLGEQRALLAGLILAWVRIRYPALKADYDFQPGLIERELRWPLTPLIIDQVRCDALARRKSDGGLFYIEWKSTSTGGDEWAKQWEHNTQLLANTLAIEETLHERVEGVLIEGIIKGRRAVDRSKTSPFFGHKIQQSPLCYAYFNEDTGELSYEYTPKRGFRKIRVWERWTAEAWVAQMPEETLRAMFAPVPPIIPNRRHLERWRRQTILAERTRADQIALIREHHIEIGMTPPCVEFDAFFPMNDSHCHRYWGYPCAFEPLCFREEIEQDPIGSGLYRERTLHHPAGEEDQT